MANKTKSRWIKVRGLCSYARVYEPDEFMDVKKWKINLHPDEHSREKIKALTQKKEKDSNEAVSGVPGKFFTFDRPEFKVFGEEKRYFSPPEIRDKNDDPIVKYEVTKDGINRIGEKIAIGNGSLVELDVLVYQTKYYGPGCRLNVVRILDLVEYEPEEEVEPEEDEIPFESDNDQVEKKVVEKTVSKKVSW